MKITQPSFCPHCKAQKDTVTFYKDGHELYFCTECWQQPTREKQMNEDIRSSIIVELILLILKVKL